MPTVRLEACLREELRTLEQAGTLKGPETVICGVLPPEGDRGARYLLAGEGDRSFIRMNSNGYLGLSLHPELIEAEERAVRAYGTGPGAARFISGTWAPHVELEARLAAFHGREAAMIFNSAYAASIAVLAALITPATAVISDELNHNCIINAIRMARPGQRHVYRHVDMAELQRCLALAAATSRRAVVVTDGIFSMRGDHAPLDRIAALAREFDESFPENLLVVVDDSHGVGAFGATGRGTEEHAGGGAVDLLIGTIGKAFGVNGGYVVARRTVIDYLREKAPTYVYSNPITAGEAAAAVKALELFDSPRGLAMLAHLRAMTGRFEQGLRALGCETIPGDHPIVPLLVRDTDRTAALVGHLRDAGVLATGIAYPVVPRGEEEIRFQISVEHTACDIDEVVKMLATALAATQTPNQ